MYKTFFLFLLLLFLLPSFSQDQPEIDSAVLEERLESELEAFQKFTDSLAREKGRSNSPGTDYRQEKQRNTILEREEKRKELEQQQSQLQKVILGLFAAVMIMGIILSRNAKRKRVN